MPSNHNLNTLDELKLFAAIFLDGELQGGPLEGLNFQRVANNIIRFLNYIRLQNNENDSQYAYLHADTIKAMCTHLSQISSLAKFQLTNDTDTCADRIFNTFEQEKAIFFPGGWTANPAGHAMIYHLFYDKNGDVIFLCFNTGDGAQYHKKIASTQLSTIDAQNYKERFNPVYAIHFNDKKKINEYGGLRAWIKKLVEPRVLPLVDPTYFDNNAEGIYEKILPTCAYLGGKIIDPTPFFSYITTGQRSGTCTQHAIQEMLRLSFKRRIDYDRFIFDYRLHVLQDYLTNQKLPQAYEKEFFAAVANTARMISSGKRLERALESVDKALVIERLSVLNQHAKTYFNQPRITQPQDKIEIAAAELRVLPLSWMPGDTISSDNKTKVTIQTPTLLFDESETFINAIRNLDEASQQTDKTIFVHNLEQVCFTFCAQFKDFKTKSFSVDNTADEWAQTIALLHKYSIEYFDFYFKNKSKYTAFSFLFGTKKLENKKNRLQNAIYAPHHAIRLSH